MRGPRRGNSLRRRRDSAGALAIRNPQSEIRNPPSHTADDDDEDDDGDDSLFLPA